ncbi:MAG: hypothetical protein DCC67_13210 [Planctomycetota bacterium]|nr:MAG: hypothetical protein DCC67_13210 [Planctomycetota bacterium]
MSLSVWDYVRRRTCEAMLAGFQDALDHLERQDQAQLMHAAAKSFRKRLNELPHNGNGSGSGNHADAASAGSSQTGAQAPARPKPPAPQHGQQQSLPGVAGPPAPVPSVPPASSQPPQHRGPGRPRKEVHG